MSNQNPANSKPSFFWLCWYSTILIIIFIHLLTISISPTVWQDEVQILDYGRVFWEPHSDWSINWNFTSSRPYFPLSYLSGAPGEILLRLSDFSVFAPRLFPLVGAVSAATVSLYWLLARKVLPTAAWLISLAFLLDPIFVGGYRGARVDCWVFAFCLGSCYLLRLAHYNAHNLRKVNIYSALSGSLASLAFFIWPSAVLLYPLILLELLSLVLALKPKIKQKSSVYLIILAFLSGGIITTIFLLIPIWEQFVLALSDTAGAASQRSGAEILFRVEAWKGLLASFRHSYFILLFAFISLAFKFRKGLMLATLLAILAVIFTGVYVHRAVYLLPYFLALIGELFSTESVNIKFPFEKLFSSLILASLVVWASSLSLVLRPAIALNQKSERDPVIIENVARSSIGAGDYNVYFVDAFEFYHAGRKLGWHMFSSVALGDSNLQLTDTNFHDLLSRIDYVVGREKTFDSDFNLALEAANFNRQASLLGENNYEAKALGTARLYGPYVLYKRVSLSEN